MANSIFLFPGGLQISGGGSVIVPVGGQFLAPDGSNTVPGYGFTLEPATGWFRPSSATIQGTFNGTAGPSITATQVNVPAGGVFRSNSNGTKIDFPADGQVRLLNNAGTGFDFLMFGGSSASFPALKRLTTTLTARLADDSADADFLCGALTTSGNAFVGTTRGLGISSKFSMFSGADGNIEFYNAAGNNFGLLKFGGTTSSFPALKRSAAVLQVKLADDSALGTIESATSIISSKAFIGAGFISAISPSISSGFGTSPSIVSGGIGMAFRVNVGTGGAASSGVIAMNTTAPNGWNAYVENITGTAANRANVRTVVTAGSTTTVTVQNQTISTGAAVAWTASDILLVIAFAW